MKFSKLFLALLLLCITSLSVNATIKANDPVIPGFKFQFTVEGGEETVEVTGESDLSMTPSSYTIVMNVEDIGRCVIHMLNFSVAPGPGTYDVENTEDVRTAMLCMIESMEPVERLVSYSGTFTISELHRDFVKGHFDMMMKGPISGKEFRVHGSVTSENLPSDLRSENNPFIRN